MDCTGCPLLSTCALPRFLLSDDSLEGRDRHTNLICNLSLSVAKCNHCTSTRLHDCSHLRLLPRCSEFLNSIEISIGKDLVQRTVTDCTCLDGSPLLRSDVDPLLACADASS